MAIGIEKTRTKKLQRMQCTRLVIVIGPSGVQFRE